MNAMYNSNENLITYKTVSLNTANQSPQIIINHVKTQQLHLTIWHSIALSYVVYGFGISQSFRWFQSVESILLSSQKCQSEFVEWVLWICIVILGFFYQTNNGFTSRSSLMLMPRNFLRIKHKCGRLAFMLAFPKKLLVLKN